jgi:hypothetical protein
MWSDPERSSPDLCIGLRLDRLSQPASIPARNPRYAGRSSAMSDAIWRCRRMSCRCALCRRCWHRCYCCAFVVSIRRLERAQHSSERRAEDWAAEREEAEVVLAVYGRHAPLVGALTSEIAVDVVEFYLTLSQSPTGMASATEKLQLIDVSSGSTLHRSPAKVPDSGKGRTPLRPGHRPAPSV